MKKGRRADYFIKSFMCVLIFVLSYLVVVVVVFFTSISCYNLKQYAHNNCVMHSK